MKNRKMESLEMLENVAKENNYDVSRLCLNYDKCSDSFLSCIMSYIQEKKEPFSFIETCEILFPENPTDLPEEISLAVLAIDNEGTAAFVKREIDAGHCELSMEGLVFESMYQKALHAADTVFTRCGRLSYDDKYSRGLYQMDIFMSEGIQEAREIYSDIQHAYNCTHKELADSNFMFGHLMPGYMLGLTMDDMNIRGPQVLYGYEYANHSAEVLAELIDKRDPDLVKYINKRTVEEYDQSSHRHKDCLAVEHGTSFDKDGKQLFFGGQERLHTKFDPLFDDKQEIIRLCTKERFEIDYASMDINRATPTEEGIKIAKAHGFEMVWSDDIKNAPKIQSILMASKDRDAFLYANAGINDTMAYGGCSIYAITNDKGIDPAKLSWKQLQQNCECFGNEYQGKDNPYRNFQIRECHYDHGCFKQYEFLKQTFPARTDDIPWKAAPVNGLPYMPIPETLRFPVLFQETQNRLFSLLHADVDMIRYQAEKIVNDVNFVRKILPSLPQDIKDMYIRYDKEPCQTIAEALPYFDIDRAINSVGIAFRYLELPKDEEEAFLSEIKNHLMECTKSYNGEQLDYANEQWNRIKWDIDTWDKALEVMLPDDYTQESDYGYDDV